MRWHRLLSVFCLAAAFWPTAPLRAAGVVAVAIDEIRISSIARTPDALGHAGPLRPDAATLHIK